MSCEAMSWAFSFRGITPLQRLILIDCANNADVDGWVELSFSRVTRDLECGRGELSVALFELQGAGAIDVWPASGRPSQSDAARVRLALGDR
jgi:hypothetical protein